MKSSVKWNDKAQIVRERKKNRLWNVKWEMKISAYSPTVCEIIMMRQIQLDLLAVGAIKYSYDH